MSFQHITYSIETVTPETAADLLTRNLQNRPLSSWRVKAYADEMRAGKFLFNGETIKLSITGKLIDGQHRLKSVIVSGVAQRFLIVRGLPESVIPTLDTGRTRTAADALAVTATTTTAESRTIAAAVKGLCLYEGGGNWLAVRGGSTRRLTANHIVTEYTRAHTKELTDNFNWIKAALAKSARALGAGEALFFYTVFARINAEQAKRFIKQVMGGVMLEGGSTEHTLNQYLMAVRSKEIRQNPAQVRHAIIKGWNATREGKALTTRASIMPKDSDPITAS